MPNDLTTKKRNILAQNSERIYYFDEMTYFQGTNGLFMGTYEEWLALGGKPEPLFEKNQESNAE